MLPFCLVLTRHTLISSWPCRAMEAMSER
jgi:hypothetical protein